MTNVCVARDLGDFRTTVTRRRRHPWGAGCELLFFELICKAIQRLNVGLRIFLWQTSDLVRVLCPVVRPRSSAVFGPGVSAIDGHFGSRGRHRPVSSYFIAVATHTSLEMYQVLHALKQCSYTIETLCRPCSPLPRSSLQLKIGHRSTTTWQSQHRVCRGSRPRTVVYMQIST